jgi:hypothetical protein
MDKKTKHEEREKYIKELKEAEERKRYDRQQHPADYLPAYRPHSKAKEGIESMPTYYHTGDMDRLLSAYKTAQTMGAPKIPPEKLAAMALVEGRSDIGYNTWNTNNPRAVKLHTNLVKSGADPYSAGFAAAILDKHETANRLKIPFENAWNGTGTSIWDKTGKDYAEKVKEAEKSLSHPKNQPLYNFIKQRAEADEEMPALAAVEMPQEYTDGNWKLI